MADSMLVPLSALDQNGVETSSITLGYVVKSVDVALLEAAAKRMINKWRLLAGRLEWSKENTTWCIRVPLKGDVSHRVKFTTSRAAVPLDTPLTILGENTVDVLPRPSLKFFRHSSTPNSLGSFSSSNAPLVSIHVSEIANCTCVGISVPHGVFDAFGIGQIIQALDAELSGKSWDVPAFSETNVMRETLNELAAATPLYTEEPAALTDVQREFIGMSVKNALTFGVGIGYEYLWQKTETKGLYLGQAAVEGIVQRVKDEVKNSGPGWVSTGDVLAAWFLKAAFSQETDSNSVCVTHAISLRSTLVEKNPAFENYTHNSIMPCSMPPVTKQEIATKSLAELAVLNRRSFDAVRNIPFVQAYNHWVASVGGNAIPSRRRGAESVIFSNQVIGHLDAIDFGSETFAFWHWNAPLLPDHSIVLNKFKGGYIIEAAIRRKRWNAVAQSIIDLKA
ncbi:hypothetical protein H0H87_007042 [Tephrocybe sp. NHM501043]|nr:hypothetical protein H0H87_007042 [Tephrocybe sp. NHM501043]